MAVKKLQYGIRGMMLLTVAVAVCTSFVTARMKRSQLVEDIFRRGGYVISHTRFTAAPKNSGQEFVPAELPGPEFLRELFGEYCFVEEFAIVVLPNRVCDDDLARLKYLGRIGQLQLSGNCVSEDGLLKLAKVRSIKTLYLVDMDISDAKALAIMQLRPLVELAMHNVRISEQQLGMIRESAPDTRIWIDGIEAVDWCTEKKQLGEPDRESSHTLLLDPCCGEDLGLGHRVRRFHWTIPSVRYRLRGNCIGQSQSRLRRVALAGRCDCCTHGLTECVPAACPQNRLQVSTGFRLSKPAHFTAFGARVTEGVL